MNEDYVSIFNPLNKPLTVDYDLSGNAKHFILNAKEITHVPKMYAEHVKKALLDAVFNAKGDYRKDRDMQMKEFLKEISI